MAKTPVIGIDLGTSYSAAAVCRDGRAEIIPNKNGERLIPSYVYYEPKSTESVVGSAANHLGGKCMTNFIYDAKRIIGRKFDDAYVQKLRDQSVYQFKIVRGEEDKAEYEAIRDDLVVQKSPEQASSEILKYLRESASEYLAAEVTEAVISVPAHFSNAQRAATKAAAELAGLKVLKLISEPVAGAVYYTKEKRNIEGTLLVFDMGGGSLDVSIVKLSKKKFSKEKFEVLNVEGDTFLGGRDYDNVLLDYFIAKIIEKFNLTFITPKLIIRLKGKCTALREKLSTETQYSLILDCIRSGDDDFIISLTRGEYNQLTNELTSRALRVVQKCLTGARLPKIDINEVILVGGMTRTPIIREELCKFFGRKELKTDMNPDEAVALGAAIQASALKHKSKELERYIVPEITPLSLGIGVSRGLMNIAIKKNTPLPAKGRLVLRTWANDQRKCKFPIFEGEKRKCVKNIRLGEFSVKDLPKGKAGDVKFEVNFFLNHDGILEIEAHETSANIKSQLTVALRNYRLCQHKIAVIENDETNSDVDILFEKYNKISIEILYVYNDIFYGIQPKLLFEADRRFVEEKYRELKASLDGSVYTEMDKLIQAYTSFRLVIEGIVGQFDIKWPEFF